jgi:hypothetical protein
MTPTTYVTIFAVLHRLSQGVRIGALLLAHALRAPRRLPADLRALAAAGRASPPAAHALVCAGVGAVLCTVPALVAVVVMAVR